MYITDANYIVKYIPLGLEKQDDQVCALPSLKFLILCEPMPGLKISFNAVQHSIERNMGFHDPDRIKKRAIVQIIINDNNMMGGILLVFRKVGMLYA